jgi:hypothetical protein
MVASTVVGAGATKRAILPTRGHDGGRRRHLLPYFLPCGLFGALGPFVRRLGVQQAADFTVLPENVGE